MNASLISRGPLNYIPAAQVTTEMTMARFPYLMLAAMTALGFAVPASAGNIYCTVVGVKQGKFTGDGVHGGSTEIPVYALTQEVKVPYDAASGQATGKRQHSPVTIVKELDKSSPLFFSAVVTNETLRSVTCTLYRDVDGALRAYYRIALTNANIVEVKDSGDGVNGTAQSDEHERISFVYQKMEVTDLDSNTTAIDDWSLPQ
jgi:type VI secretion system secreted protein Hcp